MLRGLRQFAREKKERTARLQNIKTLLTTDFFPTSKDETFQF